MIKHRGEVKDNTTKGGPRTLKDISVEERLHYTAKHWSNQTKGGPTGDLKITPLKGLNKAGLMRKDSSSNNSLIS